MFTSFHTVPAPALTRLRLSIKRKIRTCLYYRQSVKRINCTLTNDEHAGIKRRADRLKMPVTACLKELALAYSDQRYLVPTNLEEKLEAVVLLLRNVANNINQLAHKANATGQTNYADYLKLKEEVLSLEDRIKKATRNPKVADDHQIHEPENRQLRPASALHQRTQRKGTMAGAA